MGSSPQSPTQKVLHSHGKSDGWVTGWSRGQLPRGPPREGRMGHSLSDHPWHFSYVWEHLDVGYVQGMCDLLAPLLVILDNGERWGM